jgi:hypothetical protein
LAAACEDDTARIWAIGVRPGEAGVRAAARSEAPTRTTASGAAAAAPAPVARQPNPAPRRASAAILVPAAGASGGGIAPVDALPALARPAAPIGNASQGGRPLAQPVAQRHSTAEQTVRKILLVRL